MLVLVFISCSLKTIHERFILHDAESCEADHHLGHVVVISLLA